MKSILLSQGQVALVDDEDFDALSRHKWCAQKRKHGFHAARYDEGVYVYMHRIIMQASGKMEVDHRDGDGLNNRRFNLRKATKSQNGQGFRHLKGKTSRYRGVFRNAHAKKWQANISKNSVSTYLGLFDNEQEAAYAYDRAAKEKFGEFAQLNFPEAL